MKMSRLVLTDDQEGYVGVTFDEKLIGKTAIVQTELKPAGHILVDGKQVQALSETGFVSKGVEVLIVGGRGAHLLVREKKHGSS
jgi:membrane-bound serine protease (ClpP class)